MSTNSQSNGGPHRETSTTTEPPTTLWGYVSRDVMATILFTLRMSTIIYSFAYILSTTGLLGEMLYAAYQNALLSAFLTFALRLYQRKQHAQIRLFSWAMLDLLSSEDSGHYLIYTFFFLNQLPQSVFILPPLLYAIIFTHSYTEGLKQHLPWLIQNVATKVNDRIIQGQRDAFRFIAYTEIFILMVIIWSAFMGYMFVLAPVFYYYFLKARYRSQRNHYVKNCFSELRFAAEHYSRHPNCPAFLSSLLTRSISLVSRLAPVEQIPGHTA